MPSLMVTGTRLVEEAIIFGFRKFHIGIRSELFWNLSLTTHASA